MSAPGIAAPDSPVDGFDAGLPPPVIEPPPLAGRTVTRRPVAPPPPYEEHDDYDDAEYSMLRNPYVLAALAVAGAIMLAVVFVIAFSSNDSGIGSAGSVNSRTPTPLPGDLPGVQAEVIAIAAIREGPGLEFFELGLLRNGQDVTVVGRNDDASWYQIIFAGADLKGWVPDSALRLPDGAEEQIEEVVFSPIPKPSVEQPTPTPPVSPTEEALGPPDVSLEVLGNICPTSGVLNVAMRNVGDVDITDRQVVVTISTPDGVLSEQTLSITLGVGQIVPINTGLEVEPPRTTVAVVFVSAPQDVDPSNNVVTCVVSEGGGGGRGGAGQNATTVPPPVDDDDDD